MSANGRAIPVSQSLIRRILAVVAAFAMWAPMLEARPVANSTIRVLR